MLAPPLGAAAVRLTLPCPVLPAVTLVALSATADTVGVVVVGTVGEPDPLQALVSIAPITVAASVMNLGAMPFQTGEQSSLSFATR
jgi:hypothetical protein